VSHARPESEWPGPSWHRSIALQVLAAQLISLDAKVILTVCLIKNGGNIFANEPLKFQWI
jgi:hypothetical protein